MNIRHFIKMRILVVGLVFLTVTYCAVRMIDIVSWTYPIPVELVVIALSLVMGIVCTPVVSIFVRREEYRTYMGCVVLVMAVLLALTYHFWTRWHYDPQFFTLSLVLPGMVSHFIGLYVLSRGKGKAPC
jgi:hypothetical protein